MVRKLRDRMLQGPAGIDRPFGRDELLDLARGVDLGALDSEGFVQFNEARYARNVVFANEHFELVYICWRPGQASAIHDHGESWCLYLVVDGEFEEELFELDDAGEPKALASRRWKTGEITIAAGEDIHRIGNDTDRDLRTIHIYSPPLKQTSKNFTPVPRTIPT
ncbi:MAG: cysteine dioxygenase [Planctomycetota bacterium]|jgi:cysteine dioxygenase